MDSQQFVSELVSLSFKDTFNPYADQCPVYDAPDAPKTRAKTLLSILQKASQVEIDSLWIGRDLGYRGGRRTGLALTDDVHINRHVSRWGVSAERPTKGALVAERTAAIVWEVLESIDAAIFLWNVFPLHPHESNEPFSNRSHNSEERQVGEYFLSQIIDLLKPRRLVAIGNDAAQSANRIIGSHDVIQVRHPSYGGQTQFIHQVKTLYGLNDVNRQTNLFS